MRRDLHEANRLSWNEATRAHNSHKNDQSDFLRRGGSTLFPEELELLGELQGQRLLHLQCNAGQDTLSLANRGARVKGVDISDEAIAFARGLSSESGIEGDFERADVYDWLDRSEPGRFDIAFSSYGAICWLSDLGLWARGIASVLAPGGRLVLIDFHPALMVFDETWQPRYSYFGGADPLVWENGINDYVGMTGEALAPSGFAEGESSFRNPHPSYEFQWSIADILTAVLDSGLTLEIFREYPYANGWKGMERMRALPGRRFAPPEDVPSIPMMFGLRARR